MCSAKELTWAWNVKVSKSLMKTMNDAGDKTYSWGTRACTVHDVLS